MKISGKLSLNKYVLVLGGLLSSLFSAQTFAMSKPLTNPVLVVQNKTTSAGRTVDVPIKFHKAGFKISGLSTIVKFDRNTLQILSCSSGFNPALTVYSQGFYSDGSLCTVGSNCDSIKLILLNLGSTSPIINPDGAVVLSCRAQLKQNAPPGNSWVELVNAQASTGDGPVFQRTPIITVKGRIIVE